MTGQPDYAGRAGMRIRGQSTAQLEKKPYKLETWNEDDSDLSVSLLNFPSDSDTRNSNFDTARAEMPQKCISEKTKNVRPTRLRGNREAKTIYLIYLRRVSATYGTPQ